MRVIEAIHQLFSWLGHLFADSVYNGAKLRDALVKFVTGPIKFGFRFASLQAGQIREMFWI